MSISDMLETLMLGCFSIGWYWSIFTMIRTGKPYGKSAVFVGFTVTGYTLGLTAQVISWQSTGVLNYLLVMYTWNLAVTVIDLALVAYLTQLENLRALAHARAHRRWAESDAALANRPAAPQSLLINETMRVWS